MNVLLTGFGPFPGAPFNPTGPLVQELARRRHAGSRRTAHIFRTRYDFVDRELPRLLLRHRPDVVVMFGLAVSTAHVRIETKARNAISCVVPDAGGHLPQSSVIVEGAPATMPLLTKGQLLLRAARSVGVEARLSDNAGNYLCNYLCWRATERATRPGGPELAAFVHVPDIRSSAWGRPPLTFGQLLRAGEAIVRAAVAAVRTGR